MNQSKGVLEEVKIVGGNRPWAASTHVAALLELEDLSSPNDLLSAFELLKAYIDTLLSQFVKGWLNTISLYQRLHIPIPTAGKP